MVRHFKNKYKLLKSRLPRSEALSKYLFTVRAATHCTTNVSPGELQLGRKLRTRLDAIKPTLQEFVEHKQEKQREYFKGNREIILAPNDPILVRVYSTNLWRDAIVEKQCSPVTYLIKTNKTWKRHADQLKPRGKTLPNVLIENSGNHEKDG